MTEVHGTGVVLSRRRHGAGGAIVSVHTAEHGRIAGHVHAIRSPAARGLWLTGNVVTLVWRGRRGAGVGVMLDGQVEASPAADLEGAVGRLTALAAACSLVHVATAECEPAPALHADLLRLVLEDLHATAWRERYAAWERRLGEVLGYGPPRLTVRGSGPCAEMATSGAHLAAYATGGRRLPPARRAFARVMAVEARA
jgi:DNA repair protein RecO (recombination protein O)